MLATASTDNSIKIWNISLASLVQTLNGHINDINCLEQVGDDLIASASADYTIKLWNITSGENYLTLRHSDNVAAIKLISKDKLVGVSDDFSSIIWNITNGTALIIISLVSQSYCFGSNPCTRVYYYPSSIEKINDAIFAVGMKDIALYYSNGSLIQYLKGHTHKVYALKLLSSDTLASGSADNGVRIWNLTSKTSQILTPAHTNDVMGLELVDVDVLASVSADFTIKLWNLTSWSNIKTFNVHTAAVYAIKNVDSLIEGILFLILKMFFNILLFVEMT